MTSPSAHAWDAHADTYARLFSPLTSQLAESMFRLSERHLAPGAKILDVACGCGALTLPAARHAQRAGGEVLATDFSPAMVERTARAAQGLPVRGEVHDGQALALADASFDAVFSCFGIFLFPDRPAGWAEAARVLRPGGVFATTVWRGPEHNAMLRAQMEPILRALPERLRQAPGRSWMDIADPAALVAEVMSSGPFVDPELYVLQASIVLPDSRTTWLAMQDNPVMGGLLRACEPEELAAVERSVLERLGELAGGLDRPLVFDTSCHVLVARRG